MSCSRGTPPPPGFSDELRQAGADLWEAQSQHPFVCGIRDGSLEADRFRFYVRQDYQFLIDHGRVLAMACARAPRLEWMARFAEIAHSTLRTEMTCIAPSPRSGASQQLPSNMSARTP